MDASHPLDLGEPLSFSRRGLVCGEDESDWMSLFPHIRSIG